MILCDNVNKYNFIEQTKGKEIILFGTGNMMYEAINMFSFSNDFKISLVIDNSLDKIGSEIVCNGITYTIQSPEILFKINPLNTIMLITTKFYKEIVKQCNFIDNISGMKCFSYVKINWNEDLFDRSMSGLIKLMKKKGLSKEVSESTLHKYKKKREKKQDYLVIPKINLIVTDKCTLKCDKCRALMPDTALEAERREERKSLTI